MLLQVGAPRLVCRGLCVRRMGRTSEARPGWACAGSVGVDCTGLADAREGALRLLLVLCGLAAARAEAAEARAVIVFVDGVATAALPAETRALFVALLLRLLGDAATGGLCRAQALQLLPACVLDTLQAQLPTEAISTFDAEHRTPELVWGQAMRSTLEEASLQVCEQAVACWREQIAAGQPLHWAPADAVTLSYDSLEMEVCVAGDLLLEGS